MQFQSIYKDGVIEGFILCMVYFICSVLLGNTIIIYCIIKEMSFTPLIVMADQFLLSLVIVDLLVSLVGQPRVWVCIDHQ